MDSSSTVELHNFRLDFQLGESDKIDNRPYTYLRPSLNCRSSAHSHRYRRSMNRATLASLAHHEVLQAQLPASRLPSSELRQS
jgi:hypothetical protein